MANDSDSASDKNLTEKEYIQKIADQKNISTEHAKILVYSEKWDGLEEVNWSTWDIVRWKTFGGQDFLFEKKEQFVSNYSDVIKDAALQYDIPVFLLAGIAYSEFGGDPMWIDDIAYAVRSFDWCGPEWVDEHMTITKEPNLTSFGNTSIQVRRALEMLEYDTYTNSQKNAVISSLKDPVQNIYMAAKHLDVLRNVDFFGVHADELTDGDIQIIASRYNLGPDVSKEKASEWSYGKSIINNKDRIMEALG